MTFSAEEIAEDFAETAKLGRYAAFVEAYEHIQWERHRLRRKPRAPRAVPAPRVVLTPNDRKLRIRASRLRYLARWREVHATLIAALPVFTIVPVKADRFACSHCGGILEIREGCARPTLHRCAAAA